MGKASDYPCIDCGARAQDWSCVSQEYIDVKDFAPRCKPCHIKYDHKKKSERISKLKMGHAVSKETREKLRNANLGKKHTEETRLKQRAVRLGKKYSLVVTEYWKEWRRKRAVEH